jgi:hypothetical protein
MNVFLLSFSSQLWLGTRRPAEETDIETVQNPQDKNMQPLQTRTTAVKAANKQ